MAKCSAFGSLCYPLMNHALHFPASPARQAATTVQALARPLDLHDIDALLALEHAKWDRHQAATAGQLKARIAAHPQLSLGAFCAHSGQVLASLFLKPVPDDFARYVNTWDDAMRLPVPVRSRSLFGISLSSRHGAGVDALLQYFWPRALHGGWRSIYLGSPLPGLSDWLARHAGGSPQDYMQATRRRLPLDPQLRYYHRRGFRCIVALKPGYFPHQASLDHGVLLRGTVPLSAAGPLWKRLPVRAIQPITDRMTALL